MTIRLVHAEDNYLLREGTAALLSVVPDVDHEGIAVLIDSYLDSLG